MGLLSKLFGHEAKPAVPAEGSERTLKPGAEEQGAAPEDRTVRLEPADGRLPPSVPRRLLSYRVGNLQGVGSRERQEDSFAFVNAMDVSAMRTEGLLAVVADGMGGMADGKTASETAVASLREDFRSMDRSGGLCSQLREGVLRAADRVYDALGGAGGSTMVACLFYGERLYWCSVGDSFLWLLRDGELLRLNREDNMLHQRYQEAIAQGSMDPGPAREDPEKAALTAFLGMEGLAEADAPLRPLKIHAGDRFLLCTDGVGAVLTETEVRECLELSHPAETASSLEAAVLSRNNPYQDNYTALTVWCGY